MAPPDTLGWGRCPVFASVDDVAWRTSAWRDRTGRTLLPVPKKVRGDRTDGAVVQVTLRY
jgi:hypothetical protein